MDVMKWMRVAQWASFVTVCAAVATSLTLQGDWFTILPVAALTFLALSIGFSLGVSHMTKAIHKELRRVPVVGGPMDGMEIPAPPGFEDIPRDVAWSMGVAGHPEGVYVRSDDGLVWEET